MPSTKYYESLNDIVDDLNNEGKEIKITKLPTKKGPKKQILFRGSRYA